MKSRKYKFIPAILLTFILTLTSVPGMAEEQPQDGTVQLTLQQAVDKTLGNTNSLNVIDQNIKAMWVQEDALMQLSNARQQQLDAIADYKRLYEKVKKGEPLGQGSDLLEAARYAAYQQIYGPVPPDIPPDQMFDDYIRDRDITHYSLWAEIQKLKTTKEVTKNTVAIGARQLYEQVLVLQDSLALQQELYGNMSGQYEQMLVKYRQGQASGLEKELSGLGLEQQKLEVNKLARTLDNVEMMLKQQTGIPLTAKISLKADGALAAVQLKPYEDYLNKALSGRSEILNAKMDLQVKQRELDIMKEYIRDEKMPERLEVQNAADEKSNALKEAVNTVTGDLSTGYADVKLKQKEIDIAQEQMDNALRQYNEGNLRYQQGLLPLSTLWNLEISLTNCKIAYNKAVRDFNSAVYRLETASSVGPGYNTQIGGH
ncbi:MAG: TolC family protein [Clostridiales bacterium]|jgi:hypothetical protein|nr:TolC family protein [Eubacteriales bacterium]MDH7567781.1 TolC family protein [Clostridiales bacterium]